MSKRLVLVIPLIETLQYFQAVCKRNRTNKVYSSHTITVHLADVLGLPIVT